MANTETLPASLDSRGVMECECSKCTRIVLFRGNSRADCLLEFEMAGWGWVPRETEGKRLMMMVCDRCPK